jgi:H+/Cl- antiporter ClcA
MFSKLRLRLKHSFDRIKNERFKLNLLQAIPFWIASVITGLVAVIFARLFGLAEKFTENIFQFHPALLFIITPLCFVISWWVVTVFAPNAKGSGIPQTMAAIELVNPGNSDKISKLLSMRIMITKIISSLILAAGGGAIGREGPTIQIAGSIFRKINQLLPDWWPKISKRNMIMTGAAAGLAAAFNTPLGGIVFAVEELTKTHISYFKTALFSAVLIAGLTAQALLGPYLYLGYPQVSHLSSWIFIAVIIVALLTGLLGSIMSKIILLVFRWRSSFRNRSQYLMYAIVSALIIALIAYFINQNILNSGKAIMTTVLFTDHKVLPWYTPLLRIGGSVLSFTIGGAGGIFAPALSAGASMGSVMSGWLHLLPEDTNLIVLCGMVGFLTGVTRTPFTSAILVLEMTDRHNVIFHLMLAAMIASIVAIVIDKHSLYDHLKIQYLNELKLSPEPED